MSDLRFKVGAAVDASWDVVFGTILQKAKKARAQITAEMVGAGKGMVIPMIAGGSKAGAALAKVGGAAQAAGTSVQRAGGVMGAVADGARERFELLSKGLKKIPADLSIVAREAERELGRIQRMQARQSLGLPTGGAGGPSTFGKRMGYWAFRNFSPITPTLGVAANIGRDVARGAGINLDLGSQVASSVERQDLATRLSIQGYKSYKAGTGDPNGQKVSAQTLSSEAFAHGNAVGMDPNEILKAQTKFVDLTGDLDTARGVMTELGKVSNATGTSMEDTASAAAGISKALETTFGADTTGRIKATKEVLLELAGQGKEGAVELKNYASQMSKIAAAANAVGGDRKEAFNLVGMVVQESRAHGGSTTATQAATSVAAFVRDIAKDASSKKPHLPFIESVFNRDSAGHRTSLKSPVAIIEAAVLKSHGDEAVLRSWFRNSTSYKAVGGFAATYRDAERIKPGSGRAALEAELDTLHKAAITEEDARNANTEVLNTTKAKAQEFNNELGQITDKMMSEIVPAMSKAGPDLVAGAGHIADFVAWAAGNPWGGVEVALAASVAKSGIEQGLRSAVEHFPAFSGAIGGLTFALMAGIVAINAAAESLVKDQQQAALQVAGSGADIANLASNPNDANIAKAKADADALQKQIDKDGPSPLAEGLDLFGISSDPLKEQTKELTEHIKALNDLRLAIQEATNKKGGGMVPPPRVDDGVRHGPFRDGLR